MLYDYLLTNKFWSPRSKWCDNGLSTSFISFLSLPNGYRISNKFTSRKGADDRRACCIDVHFDDWYDRIKELANEADAQEKIVDVSKCQMVLRSITKEQLQYLFLIIWFAKWLPDFKRKAKISTVVSACSWCKSLKVRIGAPTQRSSVIHTEQIFRHMKICMHNLTCGRLSGKTLKVAWQQINGSMDEYLFPAINSALKGVSVLYLLQLVLVRRLKMWIRSTMSEERLIVFR